MARTKTRYREIKSDIPPVEETPEPNIPAVEIDGEKVEPVVAASIEAPAEVEPSNTVAHAIEAAATADDAALALKRQVEALRQSEELQRQHAAYMAAQRPPTREEKLALWKQQGGMHEAELKFLEANPELIDFPQLTAFAANEAAQQGHERGSEAHMEKTKAIFHEHLARMQEQAENPALQPTPEFFRPPPPPPAPAPRSPAQYVSAPVSRDVPGPDRERYGNPSKVTLSVDELQIAKASGISPAEYARHKLRLEAEKRAGGRQ